MGNPNASRGPRRRGACPGVLAPMEVGDGLLVRVRVPAGVLAAPAALRIAGLAEEYGNGLLDLSHRGNLQLRGVSPGTLPALTGALAGLGLVSADVAGESVRNVLCSPTAGLDPEALLDVRPYALALDARLAADPALHALPPKFGFVVDGGGRGHLADSWTDLRFDAVATPAGVRFRVAAGGALADATPLGLCTPAELVVVAAAAAQGFLALRREVPGVPRRMAGLIAAFGGDPLALQRQVPGLEPTRDLGPPPLPRQVLGVQPGWLGVAFPFGRLEAPALAGLARLAESAGVGELRLTPWRALLLAGVGAAGVAVATGVGGVLDSADLRLRVTACSGRGACDVGTTDTHADAVALVRAVPGLLAAGAVAHVSGCEKACAHPGPSALTLTGRDGGYDLALNAAPGAPALRRGLSPAAAICALAALERLVQDQRRPDEDLAAALSRLGPGIP